MLDWLGADVEFYRWQYIHYIVMCIFSVLNLFFRRPGGNH